MHNVEPESGKRLVSVSRKLLRVWTGSLDLSGSGVSAGDSVVGASAEAYGHGVLDAESLQDNHIEVSLQKNLEALVFASANPTLCIQTTFVNERHVILWKLSFELHQDFLIYVYACCKQAYTVNSD